MPDCVYPAAPTTSGYCIPTETIAESMYATLPTCSGLSAAAPWCYNRTMVDTYIGWLIAGTPACTAYPPPPPSPPPPPAPPSCLVATARYMITNNINYRTVYGTDGFQLAYLYRTEAVSWEASGMPDCVYPAAPTTSGYCIPSLAIGDTYSTLFPMCSAQSAAPPWCYNTTMIDTYLGWLIAGTPICSNPPPPSPPPPSPLPPSPPPSPPPLPPGYSTCPSYSGAAVGFGGFGSSTLSTAAAVCSFTLNVGDTLELGTTGFPGSAWSSGVGELVLADPTGAMVLSAVGETSMSTAVGISNSGTCQPSSTGFTACPTSVPFKHTAVSAGTFTLTQSCSTRSMYSACSFTVGYTITPASVTGRKLSQFGANGTSPQYCLDSMTMTYLPCEPPPPPPPSPSPPPPSPPPPPLAPGALYGFDLWGQPETISDNPRPLHMFEVQQACSSARIQRENILNAALCQPLKALPPYACSRTVRKPVLEIISLATGNALSAMGAYFMLTSMFLKWKLARDAGKKLDADAEAPQETSTTPAEQPPPRKQLIALGKSKEGADADC
jgi:hypothetical protein